MVARPGRGQQFRVVASYMLANEAADSRAEARAIGVAPRVTELRTRVVPALEQSDPRLRGVPGASGLRLEILPAQNAINVQDTTTYRFEISNTGQEMEEQVVLKVLFPPDLQPDLDKIQGPGPLRGRAAIAGTGERPNLVIEMKAIATIRPDDRRTFVIPVIAIRAARGALIQAQLSGGSLQQPIEQSASTDIRPQ